VLNFQVFANKKGICVALSPTSAVGNASIDVAAVVSSLMTAEQRPLDAINKKIASKQLVISELGVAKTKIASLLGALKTLEDPNTYINTSVQSDSSAVLNATASNSAQVGSYVVSVDQVAKATLYNIAGFSSASATLNTNSSAGFQLTVGDTTYGTDGSKTVSGVVTANAISAIGTNPTAQALEDWINELRSVTQISATLSKMDDNQYALFVRGDNEGDSYDFSISGLKTDVSISGFSSENDLVSLDAVNGFQLTVDGVTYKTNGAGSNVNTITGTGTNGVILLKDIVTWIADLSAEHELNLLPSISQNGDIATFALAQEVENASAISIAGIGASSEYPVLISSTQTQGDETARFTFSNLKQGDSLTIAGLTMVAKQDLTSSQAATAFNTMRDGATANVVSSITNGSRSDVKTGKATVEISNVNLPTSAGTYKLTSLGDVLTMTKYVSGVVSTTASIQIITSGSSDSASSPPKVLFQSALNDQTDLSFGELGSFRINTVLAATSTETATEIASKILNAVDSAGQVTANAWVSVPDADWASDAKTNLGFSDTQIMKVVITTTGSTKIRIGTTSSLVGITGYTVPTYANAIEGYNATSNPSGVSEMAFRGTAADLSAALKTLEANSPDGLGKVSVHIVPTAISVRVDSVTGEISYYKTGLGDAQAAVARTQAKNAANNQIVTSGGTLTGYLTNITSAEEMAFIQSKSLRSSAWIGLSDLAVEGQWRWLDGPEAGLLATYFNWGTSPVVNTSENYVILKDNYTWDDIASTRSNNYLVEYNAAANSTLLRREFSLPSPGVTTVDSGSDPDVLSALNYADFSGSVSGYTTSLNGSQLTFTSTQPLTNITPNINYSFTAASGSTTEFSAPVITDGGTGSLTDAQLQFPPGGLQAGDSISVAGLTFTASRATSDTETAAAFANLANGATTGVGSSYGSYSGALAGFSSGAIVNSNQLVFTQISSGTQTSISTSSSISKAIVGTGLTVDKYSTAQNAIFTVGDASYSKTSNTISDAISGVTLSLMEEGVANVLVEHGEDKSEETIKSFMTAYNDLIKSINSMTANSSNSQKPGAFANSPTSLSFVSEIKRRVADGASYNIGQTDSSGQPYRLSLASLGLEYQLDGTLAFKSVSLLAAQSNGLRDKLLGGLKVGYQSTTDNLAKLLDSQISAISSLAYQTSENTQSIYSLNKEKDLIEDRLKKVQAGYIVQYANLNKLLFQLNSTSTNLGSALDSLAGMNSK
jgi:flagellar hook-associated protein 2